MLCIPCFNKLVHILFKDVSTSADEAERQIIYDDAPVAIICFALDDNASLENVHRTWAADLARWQLPVPTILVATKADAVQTVSLSKTRYTDSEAGERDCSPDQRSTFRPV